ncbi:hypothetical protein [Laribacter hongkongensis]|uniref:hypothetical protein n=1 Tax=Laribacter hongkongensis TaxID=168471 RepID=UPI001EFD7DC9|nr:hypothetical protein [Laribacter hongkongensis]MCG9096958.1 hypothetical protein [Laribacter hongkongensis]
MMRYPVMAERMGRLFGWLVLAVSAALGAVHVGGPTWEDKLYGAMAGVLLMGLVVPGLAAVAWLLMRLARTGR